MKTVLKRDRKTLSAERRSFMTTLDMIIQICGSVDDEMKAMPKHSQAKLSPSAWVTSGVLFALKGGHLRAFYRWLSRDYAAVFAGLPERRRLHRLLQTHQDWCDRLLAQPSCCTVIERYPIELLLPMRQGRSPHHVGKKGKDTGRWSVGIKLCWVLNATGQSVAWDWATMHVHDQHLHPVIERVKGESMVLADYGFRRVQGIPDNCQLCATGTWNERMRVETALSMLTVMCDLKRLHHRLQPYLQARLASVVAMFTVLVTRFHHLHPDAAPFQMSIAEFSL
jgi:hypothetical protein